MSELLNEKLASYTGQYVGRLAGNALIPIVGGEIGAHLGGRISENSAATDRSLMTPEEQKKFDEFEAKRAKYGKKGAKYGKIGGAVLSSLMAGAAGAAGGAASSHAKGKNPIAGALIGGLPAAAVGGVMGYRGGRDFGGTIGELYVGGRRSNGVKKHKELINRQKEAFDEDESMEVVAELREKYASLSPEEKEKKKKLARNIGIAVGGTALAAGATAAGLKHYDTMSNRKEMINRVAPNATKKGYKMMYDGLKKQKTFRDTSRGTVVGGAKRAGHAIAGVPGRVKSHFGKK